MKKVSLNLNEKALLTNSAEEDVKSQNAQICDWTAEGPLTPPRQTEAVSLADDKQDSHSCMQIPKQTRLSRRFMGIWSTSATDKRQEK